MVTRVEAHRAWLEGMESYAASFDELMLGEGKLTPDEQESLSYYYSALDLADGLPVEWQARTWCAMASIVGRIAHMIGRLPTDGDPGATVEILTRIDQQRGSQVNSYQRPRLASITGGDTLVA